MKTNATCKWCLTEFHPDTYEVNRGGGIYCSPSCAAKGIGEPKRKHFCEVCGNHFHGSGSAHYCCSLECGKVRLQRKSEQNLPARFWARVEKTESCWLWKGSRVKGYGKMSRSFPGGIRKAVLAHRVSWEIHHGAPNDSILVLHKCDNPPCVNPDHLFLGTHRDNMQDASMKFRCWRKLSVADVLLIKSKRHDGMSGADIHRTLFPHLSAHVIYDAIHMPDEAITQALALAPEAPHD